jgi:hypothetical protein
VRRVEKYAAGVHTTRSGAIGSLLRVGLDRQEQRKNEFFRRLRENLSNGDPEQEERLLDEFRDLVMGR